MSFRFELEKYAGGATRHTCPKCGAKRKFTRYVDLSGELRFPDHVGRCNREDRCGYHFTPKQYFEENPHKHELSEWTPPPRPPKPTSYMPLVLVGKTLMKHRGNNLFKFLSKQIGIESTDRLFSTYRVGTAKYWEGATLFWQIDNKGRPRTGKIMLSPTLGAELKSLTIE